MGDLNLNLIDQKDCNTETPTDTMFNQKFFPLINCPTKITDTCASAIDHIWTNVTCTNIKSGILIHDISDHLPILQITEIGKLQQNLPVKSLSFSTSNLINFRTTIENTDFNNVISDFDTDVAFKNFQSILISNFNKHFSKKQLKTNKINNPWFNKELWCLLHKKDRLNKIFLQKNNTKAKETYIKVKNQYFHLIKRKKKEYYKNKFTNYQNNIKKTWQTINEILGRSKYNTNKINCLSKAGKDIYKPIEIANTLNEHFSTVSSKLISQLPPSTTKYQDYLYTSNPSSMFFYPTCPQEKDYLYFSAKIKCWVGWNTFYCAKISS